MQIKKIFDWYGSGGGAPEQVAFQEAGAGAALASVGNLTPSLPVTDLLEGDIFIAHVGIRNTAVAINTPSGWTTIKEAIDANGAATGHHTAFYKVADGTETGNLTITFTTDTTDVKLARVYRFRGSAGDTLFGTKVTNGGGGSTTLSAPTVVCEAKSLAICLTYETDNNTFTEFTGETGGDWTLATAVFATGLGADSLLALHVATMDSAGTITGGTTTMAANATWGNLAFALERTSITAPSAQTGRLYGISISQSNGNGQASVSDIAATGRTELLSVIPRSYVWWEGANGVGWQPLQAGVNGSTNANQFGPIISMAYAEHVKYPSVDKFYVIHAVGGSTISVWNSSLKNFFFAKYNAALAYLTPTVFVGVATFHGESDAANEAASLAYEANEQTGLTDIRSATDFDDFYVLQLHNFLPAGSFPYDGNIQTAKTNNDTNGHYGASGGLAAAPTGSVIQGDNVHYNALGVINAGDNISTIMP
jgi:hypothetical protein